ncbi:YicC/YloC family endoribonuclease [Myxococcota bacterium]
MMSMTGFGVGEAPLGPGRLSLEIRSLNHRFLDVRVRMPPELSDHGFFLEQLARERFTRGRYDLGVRLESVILPPPAFALDRARSAYQALIALRDELAPGTEVPVGTLASLPDLISSTAVAESEDVQTSLRAALALALERLQEMRRHEGIALKRELVKRLEAARRCRESIAARSEDVIHAYRTRLRDRLCRLLVDASIPVDAGRLEMELAIMADRSDIAEELVRLSSHFDQFERLLNGEDAVGRRLDFLLQEISREANTVGAKSQDAPLAHLVVELKAETERMREQVQNVQ